jgi:hypothetical protein
LYSFAATVDGFDRVAFGIETPRQGLCQDVIGSNDHNGRSRFLPGDRPNNVHRNPLLQFDVTPASLGNSSNAMKPRRMVFQCLAKVTNHPLSGTAMRIFSVLVRATSGLILRR